MALKKFGWLGCIRLQVAGGWQFQARLRSRYYMARQRWGSVVYVIDNYDLSLLNLHVEFFLAYMCMVLLPRVFHVWLTLRMLSVVVRPHACVAATWVVLLSFELLLRWPIIVRGFHVPAEDPRHYSGNEGGIKSESVSLEAVYRFIMAGAVGGKFEAFNLDLESATVYLEQVELYFSANEVKHE